MPGPVLVSAPGPPTLPVSVSVPAAVSMVPPPACSVAARSVVKLAVVRSVPVSKLSAEPAAPRLASSAISSTPPMIEVPPV